MGLDSQIYRRPASYAPLKLSARATVSVPVAIALGHARVAARPFDSEEPLFGDNPRYQLGCCWIVMTVAPLIALPGVRVDAIGDELPSS